MKFTFSYLASVSICMLAFQHPQAQTELATPPLPSIPDRIFNIKDFGALGDNQMDNTAAIQKAIDAAKNSGGGKVIISTGVYLCGPLQFASNLALQIDSGAVLKMLPMNKYPGGTTTG